ncbi:putative metalloprotease CJM1_0395 family protein [Desulfosediminicola flagellatus]|uniref:putative metalloprotease CJM1_0395 family protein n=1 Tax=Desulfosediminicola flagellatus TaxID=2569541 RepID=UPI0010AD4A26|nr:putative metalloprotease CJM1_0395 family protein [Desulfosediminicola flagellatus]
MDVFSSTGSSLIAGIQVISGAAQSTTGPQPSTRGEDTRDKGPEDKVSLSPEGRQAAQETSNPQDQSEEASNAEQNTALTAEEQKQLQQLKSRDREVRIHEQAHLAAAGQYAAGGPSFTYQQGPDGNRYAVGGEVPIDVSKEATPEETLQKMTAVQQAALAPAEPSNADRQIAAQAAITAAQARQELTEQNSESIDDVSKPGDVDTGENADSESPDQNSPSESASSANIIDNSTITRRAMIDAYSAIQALG